MTHGSAADCLDPFLWRYGNIILALKTTLELPDELMRSLKIRAAQENRRLKDVFADVIRRGLAQQSPVTSPIRTRVKLPLIECARPALPGEEVTPARVAELLLEEEANDLSSQR